MGNDHDDAHERLKQNEKIENEIMQNDRWRQNLHRGNKVGLYSSPGTARTVFAISFLFTYCDMRQLTISCVQRHLLPLSFHLCLPSSAHNDIASFVLGKPSV